MTCSSGKSNLIPAMDSTEWKYWYINEHLAPGFIKKNQNGEEVLKIYSGGKFEKYGKWLCKVDGIKSRAAYKFTVDYFAERVIKEKVSICAMLSWFNCKGECLERDFIENTIKLGSGWKQLERTIEAPYQAGSVEVELTFRWSDNGSVTWRRPVFIETEPLIHRKVKVATTLITNFKNSKDGNLEIILNMIDRAAMHRPDIICLSEAIYEEGINLPPIEVAEPIPGRLTQAICEKAKVKNCYIVLNMVEKDGHLAYNTSLLIGRKGKIVGKYRKTHLPLIEAEMGFTPGKEYPVFQTDFGTIGIMTCWDHWFPEVARAMRINGAEILFIPTQGDARIQSVARAVDNGVYIVVSGHWGKNPSRIVNPVGEIIGEVADEKQGVAVVEIDLDMRYLTRYLSVGNAEGEARVLLLKERRTDSYNILLKE